MLVGFRESAGVYTTWIYRNVVEQRCAGVCFVKPGVGCTPEYFGDRVVKQRVSLLYGGSLSRESDASMPCPEKRKLVVHLGGSLGSPSLVPHLFNPSSLTLHTLLT